MVKLLIFDLDGTILDTVEDLTLACNKAMRKYGFPERTRKQVAEGLGNGSLHLIRTSLPENTDPDLLEQIHAYYKAVYEEICTEHTRPFDGIPELLDALRKNGCKVAVLSNKPDPATQILCRRYFDNNTDLCLGQKEGIPKKPSPEGVYAMMNHFGVSREETLLVGDTEVDIALSRNAKVPILSVSWGFREMKDLLSQKPDHLFQTVRELTDFLLDYSTD